MNCEAILKALSANNWSLTISILTLLVACFAILTAIRQLNVGRTETRSAQAHDIYREYLAMCIELPEFASGYTAKSNQDSQYDRYKWFVASMLFSFEQILEAKPNDQYWEVAINDQLRTHRSHLTKSRSLKNGQWHYSLQRILNKIITEEV